MDMHARTYTPSRTRSRRWAAVALSGLLLLLSACNEDGVSHPSHVLDFKRVAASPTVANVGDVIQVDWDYKAPSSLQTQTFELIRLSLQGLVTHTQTLPRAQRSITFDFDGPVTVVITATDHAGRQIDAAFDVQLDSTYHFTMKGVQQTHPGFPRLGQRKVGDVIVGGHRGPIIDAAAFDIDFTHFFGIYEVPQLDANGQPTIEDGFIDDIPPALRTLLPRGNGFFGYSFDVHAAATPPFKFRTGSSFPILDPGYLLTPDGAQFVGVRALCDAVAFAGKIAYDGVGVRDRKSRLGYRKNVSSFEPIFATINLRSDDDGNLHVADVDLGNANQGLVLSAFRGDVDTRTLGTPDAHYTGIAAYGDVGELTGSVKGSRIGFGVTLANGQVLADGAIPGVFADISSIDWDIPFHPDTNLSGLN